MEYNCKILNQPSQPILSITAKTPQSDLKKVQETALNSIISYLRNLDKGPSGPPFTVFYDMDINNLDIEIGYPVERKTNGQNEVVSGEIPEGKYVSCVYKGDHDEIESAYEALMIYANENGYETIGTCYEFYLNCNEPENMEIKIMFPLKEKE